jgi:hypothetical protein
VGKVEYAAQLLAVRYMAAFITIPKQDVDRLTDIDFGVLGPELMTWLETRTMRTQARVMNRAYVIANSVARVIVRREGRDALMEYATPEWADQTAALNQARALRDARR